MWVRTSQRTFNRLREHVPHHRMIRADDGTSICDPENLLLDEAEFIIVGCRLEERLGRGRRRTGEGAPSAGTILGSCESGRP